MGNKKFRLSSMLPKSWFHKLKNMRNPSPNPNPNPKPKPKPKPRNHTTTPTKKIHPQFTSHRHSYYFTSDRLLHNSPINPPRKSIKRNSTTKRRTINSKSSSAKLIVTSSASAGCNCRGTFDSSAMRLNASLEPNILNRPVMSELRTDTDLVRSWSSSCSCRVSSFDTDMFDLVLGLELPPILTKPVKFNDMVSEIKKRNTVQEQKRCTASIKEETTKMRNQQKGSPQTRRISPYPTGLKLRSNTPKMKRPKTVTSTVMERRKSLSGSFAIVKSSSDPQKDFRESMVEMIVENNIRASKDLEELLACYLCLNSDEYHDIIVKVFEQIWFDLTDIQL